METRLVDARVLDGGDDCESEVGMVKRSNMRESGGDGNVLSLDCIDANILVAINAISVLQD